VTASNCHNSDLFWALREGGGGTWGVVTSVTLRAFDDSPIVDFSLSGRAANIDDYWEAIERFHAFIPEFNNDGGSMYYFIIPDLPDSNLGRISSFAASGTFGNVSSKAFVDELLDIPIGELNEIPGTSFNYTSTFIQIASSRYTKTYEAPDPVGQLVIFGSRIVTRDFLESAQGPRKVTAAIRSLRTYPGDTHLCQNAVQGMVVAGPASRENAGKIDSALRPV
jgi:hypothetical protein